MGALAVVDDSKMAQGAKVEALEELAQAAVADWWSLDDELTVRFGDGWENVFTADTSGLSFPRVPKRSRWEPLAYSDAWLKAVTTLEPPVPATVCWTVEKKA